LPEAAVTTYMNLDDTVCRWWMAPSEKRLDLVEAKARLLGVSADELIELAVEAYELPAEQEAMELRSLIEAINETIPKTLRLIDEGRDKIQEALGQSSHQAISTLRI
jgi:hypothetical protein